MHKPLALHEAWPGHLMHVAVTNELDTLPRFRRYGSFGYSCWLEGWALYCEALGVDMGLYDTPTEHYGRLETELWRAVRLVVDTGVHALGWSRAEAIEYFKGKVALPDQTIESEVDRYIAMPAQALSYQLGKLVISSARAKAERELGDWFSLRDFHDAFLGLGPVSLPLLEEAMASWTGEQQAVAKNTPAATGLLAD
jgi:uncharacterized protein (DUF885 family)